MVYTPLSGRAKNESAAIQGVSRHEKQPTALIRGEKQGGNSADMDATFFSIFYKYALGITAPFIPIGLMLLGFFILRVLKILKNAHLFRVPLLAEQTIEFPEAGRVILCGQGPRITRRFWRLSYALSTKDGHPIHGSARLFRAQTTGFTWSRRELRSFDIVQPGQYCLQVHGLGPAQPRDADHWLVFMRPHLLRTMGCVIGMIFSSGLFLVSLVFFLLKLLGVE